MFVVQCNPHPLKAGRMGHLNKDGVCPTQVTAATAGFEDAGLPEFATETSVVLFSQGLLLTAGACISGIVTWRLGRPMSARIIFQSAMIGAVTAQLWELMTG